jgi:hypothetical protein
MSAATTRNKASAPLTWIESTRFAMVLLCFFYYLIFRRARRKSVLRERESCTVDTEWIDRVIHRVIQRLTSNMRQENVVVLDENVAENS